MEVEMEQQEKAETEADGAAGMDAKIEAGMDVRDTPARNAARSTRGRPFERGTSGNPGGRPKGRRNKATMAIEELLDGEAEGLARKVIDKGLEGDMAALRLCLDRLLPPRRERALTFDLPKIESVKDAQAASSAILAACAAGDLSPGEASEVMELVSAYVRMLEKTELEARIVALEKERMPLS
jgi:Family of unknown function (DUF5681)